MSQVGITDHGSRGCFLAVLIMGWSHPSENTASVWPSVRYPVKIAHSSERNIACRVHIFRYAHFARQSHGSLWEQQKFCAQCLFVERNVQGVLLNDQGPNVLCILDMS